MEDAIRGLNGGQWLICRVNGRHSQNVRPPPVRPVCFGNRASAFCLQDCALAADQFFVASWFRTENQAAYSDAEVHLYEPRSGFQELPVRVGEFYVNTSTTRRARLADDELLQPQTIYQFDGSVMGHLQLLSKLSDGNRRLRKTPDGQEGLMKLAPKRNTKIRRCDLFLEWEIPIWKATSPQTNKIIHTISLYDT
jgi:hypothetical protein